MSESSGTGDGRFRGTAEFDAARLQLIEAARTKDKFVTYPEVAQTANIGSGDSFVFEVSTLLREISEDEFDAGRPLLSAIVKGDEKIEPGPGFAKLAKGLRKQKATDDNLVFWLNEVSDLRAYWQSQPGSVFDNDNVPGCRDYIKALEGLQGRLNDKQRSTLEFQFMQPSRAMTSTELAEFHGDRTDVGKPGNLAYGSLASLFVDELNFDTWPESHNSHNYRAISTWNGTGWTMRPELAEALIEFGMVDREADGLRKNRRASAKAPSKRKQVALKHLFADQIGVPLKNTQWSWGVYDRENNRVIFRVWEDEIDNDSAPATVYLGKQLEDPRHGAAERQTHLELMASGATAFAIVCIARTKPDGGRGIAGYQDDKVARLGELVEKDGKTLATIADWVPLSTIFRSPSTSHDLVEDLREIKRNKSIDDTTRETLVSARVGQGQFRADVLRLWNNSCAVTGVTIAECLRASHIRPWKDSTNEQRLDPHNGLMLVGTLDLLFDRGLITFDDDGTMIISDLVANAEREKLQLSDTSHLRPTPTPETATYLRWHRENCFRRVTE